MKKILVIDDMDVNLKLIKSIINRGYPDFEVILCKSGREGLILANTKMPDLIVLDLLMPDMDGYEVCQQLKSQEETKAIPIIMISAAGQDSEIRARGLRFGADAFLSKPFDKVEIKELINVALQHKVREDVLQKGNLDLKLLIEQRTEKFREIEEYKEKLKVLNSTLTLAEESERRRIAEILHDNLGPTLSLANLKITSAINKKSLDDIRRLLCESTILIQDAISQSRSLTYDLIPPVLYELGLISAIKWKLDQISEAYEIKTFIKSMDVNFPISDPSRILLYRIISELLLNIIKHAHATVIEVEVTLTTGQICISLIDNGTTPNTYIEQSHLQKQEGVGMFLVRERLDSIMGTMIMEKGHDSENIVKIVVPIGK